ncbi:hypothetical protein DL89DRAFT_55780 [Linderina pennispora]|uniref:Uncharacterized protein n=1 Tax=Linderina pennispora TaxID=61395 RepID=A0A1Y1W197_9FUNG|nr:uncharacterized protein DL89DRAFT_55780 [Linderina pennispora]ORX67268.1 hypothetical protein DL89DRAFT_55780 [Linderina pennispora]
MSDSSSTPIAWETLDHWLRALYRPSMPPAVPHDPPTQQHLSRLYLLDQHMQQIYSIAQRVNALAAKEYLANLPPATAPIPRALSELSQLAVALDLPDMRLETFEVAVSARTIQGLKRQTQLLQCQERLSKVKAKVQGSLERQQKLRRLLESRRRNVRVEAQKAREWTRNGAIVQAKCQEYKGRLIQPKHMQGLEYKDMRKLDLAVEELSQAVAEKRRIHDGYAALPPDTQLAWLRLEEARQTLMHVRAECERAAERAYGS